jgi:small subunit ribosomal protein S8
MDPVADMLTIIKNGYMVNKSDVSVIYSKYKFEIAKVLESDNRVEKVQKVDNKIQIKLAYKDQKPRLKIIKQVSKSGLRVYQKSKKLKSLKSGRGTILISTSKGVMTAMEAKKKNLGGEIICQIW